MADVQLSTLGATIKAALLGEGIAIADVTNLQPTLNTKLTTTALASGTITPAPGALNFGDGNAGQVLTKQADGSIALSDAPSGTLTTKYLFEEFEYPENNTYALVGYSPFAGTITTLKHRLFSGTCTVAVKINGGTVTGLSAVSMSSTSERRASS